ncbi:MAG: ATP-binding protein [Verrucomicrobiota bacterium]
MKTHPAVFFEGFPATVPAETTTCFEQSGHLTCSPDGTLRSVDEEAARILDLSARFEDLRPLVGQNSSLLFPEAADAEEVFRSNTDRPVRCLGAPVRTWAGNTKWLMCEQRRVRSPEGVEELAYRVCDVSSCRALREEHERERAFCSGLIQNSSAPMFVLTPDHRVVFWNRACEELTGVKSDEVIGSRTHWQAFYDVERPSLADVILDGSFGLLPELYEHFARSKVLIDGWQAEGWFRNRMGVYHYLVFDAVPVRSPDGKLLAAVETISDITEHKRAEEALREKDDQLFQLQKMEAVGRLAGGIAHDFNNLLTSILGYGRLAMENLGDGHPASADLQQVVSAGEKAAKLTRQLLAMARKHPTKVAPLNLNAVVLDMARLLGRTLGEHIQLDIQAEPLIWTLLGDAGLIEQVIMNLAVNARDAMGSGGKLVIRTSNVELGQGYFEGDAGISSGRYVVLTVRDSGCGMTPEVRKRLFEPFFTTKKDGHGTGLGLSTVYGIVKQFQGHIEVVTEPNLGTTMMVYFPAVEEPVASFPPATAADLPQGTETVLVVEDEDALRELVVRTLSSLGYNTLEARDGVDAMELVKSYSEAIHLVLSDVVMPRMGGPELVRRVREIRHGIRALFCSGFTNGALVDRGLLAGTDEIIVKPYTRESLARTVRQVLDGK